ncbi:MAG: class II aldolase/adducin family protein [Proteobacteria bacterium]|nr:class II aldolase/adducin family protein [Pseudomonadota bacterium]
MDPVENIRITGLSNAQTIVWDAGLRLHREGLVARTWGNISFRVNENLFVITPSGIAYEHLTPERIVPVNLRDLTYHGKLKPSSEKGMHAAIYRDRPEIKAIIHTHQQAASSVSAARMDIENIQGEDRMILGPVVKTTPYALPGTKKLAKSAFMAIRGSNATLLSNHGAICIGKNMAEAFHVCISLESLCERFVAEKVMAAAGVKEYAPGMIHRFYLEHHARGR